MIVLVIVNVVDASSGTAIARYALTGNVRAGFSGEMPYPPSTRRIALGYDVALDGPNMPEGRLTLQLVQGGEVVATSACSTEEGASVGVCQSGGSRTGRGCERRVACMFENAATSGERNVRATLRFGEPERFVEPPRFNIVLLE